MEKNRRIQELFYDFCLNILMVFYQENILNSTLEKIIQDKNEEFEKRVKIVSNLKEDIQMGKNEKEFCRLYRRTIKYKIYFENFIRNSDAIDMFKIPLIFSEEYINIKAKDPSNKLMNKLSLFTIIDSLYSNKNSATLCITLNNIFSEYIEKLAKYFSVFYDDEKKNKPRENIKKRSQRQLFVLNKKIINKYIYLLNNIYDTESLIELFPSIQIQETNTIETIDRNCIINTIQASLEEKNLIDSNDYLIYALVIIYAISFPLHSYLKMLSYLEKLISSLGTIKYFIRQNIYILIKSLYKFYLINKKHKNYSEINYQNVKMFFYMLNNFIKIKLIVPNDEIMSILSEFSVEKNNQEKELKGSKININNNGDIFKFEKGKNFICFMKYCFTSKKTFKQNTMVKVAMKESNNSNIAISAGKKKLQPTVEIKINEFIYSTYFFAPKKVYKIIQNIFNDFFNEDGDELYMAKLKIKEVRDVISNLIQYGLELNQYKEIIPIDFLVHTLYLFKDHEKKYEKDNK